VCNYENKKKRNRKVILGKKWEEILKTGSAASMSLSSAAVAKRKGREIREVLSEGDSYISRGRQA